MTTPRRPLLLSVATLLAAIVLFQAAPGLANDVGEDDAIAGIEREGDIPLPAALA